MTAGMKFDFEADDVLLYFSHEPDALRNNPDNGGHLHSLHINCKFSSWHLSYYLCSTLSVEFNVTM